MKSIADCHSRTGHGAYPYIMEQNTKIPWLVLSGYQSGIVLGWVVKPLHSVQVTTSHLTKWLSQLTWQQVKLLNCNNSGCLDMSTMPSAILRHLVEGSPRLDPEIIVYCLPALSRSTIFDAFSNFFQNTISKSWFTRVGMTLTHVISLWLNIPFLLLKVSLNSFSRGAGNQWPECLPLFVWLVQAIRAALKPSRPLDKLCKWYNSNFSINGIPVTLQVYSNHKITTVQWYVP